MADLYESSESEDISSFFQNFLHNSSSPTNTKTSTAATGGFLCGVSGGGASAVAAESSYRRNFSDPMSFFPNEAKGSDEIISSVKRREFAKENLSFSCEEGSEAPEMQVNRAPPRSSKRSRAAEDHNISEKRRRRRINEKLKVLQNLIPNSNKTDKASMLDEAIEYLKQLQLQVQMLTTRNGLSLHPSYLPGSLQSVLVPSSELGLDEGNMLLNTNRGADTSLREQETFTQTAVGISDHASSSQPVVTPSLTNSINTDFPSGFVPLIQNHNGLVNPLASSKDICLNDTLSRLQSDTSYSWSDTSVRCGFIVNK